MAALPTFKQNSRLFQKERSTVLRSMDTAKRRGEEIVDIIVKKPTVMKNDHFAIVGVKLPIGIIDMLEIDTIDMAIKKKRRNK